MRLQAHTNWLLLLVWVSTCIPAEGQELPIQKLRVMLEKYEESLNPLRMDYLTTGRTRSLKTGKWQPWKQSVSWTHLYHDHFLSCFDPNESFGRAMYLWYDNGIWGKLAPQSELLELLPPSQMLLQHPAHLGIRWQGQRLSHWVRPAWARASLDTLSRRPVWRIDVRLPDTGRHITPLQIWIDRKQEIPLQVATVNAYTRGYSGTPYTRIVRDIEHTTSPTGILIPYQGQLQDWGTQTTCRWQGDLNSLHTAAEGFPTGLFTRETNDALQPLPHPSAIDRKDRSGPGSVIPEDIWYSTRDPNEIDTLTYLRSLSLQNEAALGTLQFDWVTHLDYDRNPRSPTHVPLVPRETTVQQERFHHQEGRYQRAGVLHRCQESLYLSHEVPVQTGTYVWDEDTLMSDRRPASISGVIDDVAQFRWEPVTPLAWTFRVFNDGRKLSELLVPLLARVHTPLFAINRWPVQVVDVRHPDRLTDYARLWLDLESGLPLQIDTYQVLNWPELVHTERIHQVSLLKLANGAWLPIKAQRIQYRNAPSRHQRVSGMAVNTESIVTEEDSINPAAFAPPFRYGQRIYNAITDRFEIYQPEELKPKVERSRPQTRSRRRPQEPSPPIPEPNEPNAPNDVNTLDTAPALLVPDLALETNEPQASVPTPPTEPLVQKSPAQTHPRGITVWILLTTVLALGGIGCYCLHASKHKRLP